MINLKAHYLLIKIDIEGFEENLFSKNFEWIDEKIIIIELHDWILKKKRIHLTFFLCNN